jgi:cyanophycinase
MRISVYAVLVAAYVSSAPQVFGEESKKSLVLVGGALQSPEIFTRIVDLAGGRGRAKIGIITGASEPEAWDRLADDPVNARNARTDALYYKELFIEASASDASFIPLDLDHIHNNSSPEVVQLVEEQTGFFFGGGDPSRLVETVSKEDGSDSPVLEAIRKRFEEGAVVAGTNAGAAVLVGHDPRGRIPMIAGGRSYEALVSGPHLYARYDYKDGSSGDLRYNPEGGLGFFNYGLVDTQFSARGRQGRIIRLAHDRAVDTVYGIDENTALVVTRADSEEVEMEVLGERGVWILDLAEAYRRSEAHDETGAFLFDLPYKAIFGVRASYLTRHDRYNPESKTVQVAPWKKPIASSDITRRDVRPSEDIFGPFAFLETARDLFQCRCSIAVGRTRERDPSFEIRMTKDPALGPSAYRGKDDDGRWHISLRNLTVAVYPIVR